MIVRNGVTSLVFREHGDEVEVRYSNRGEPYSEGVQISFKDDGSYRKPYVCVLLEEPDGVFQWHLAQAVNGKKVTMPTSWRDWQLFTSSMKCGTAARALTTALRAAVLVIQGCTVKELPAIRAYLIDYCWRVNVD